MTTEASTEQTQQQNVDSDASFATGFHRARGDSPSTPAEPPKQESPQPNPEPKSDAKTDGPAPATEEKAAATPAPDDEWKDVHPKVKQELESMRGRLDGLGELPGHVRNLQHQYGGLKSLTSSLKDAIAKATATTQAAGDATPTAEQIESAAKSEARWKQLVEDFPEWAEAIDERMKRIESQRPAPVDTSALKTEVLTDAQARIAKAKEEARAEARVLARIDNAFPEDDWEALINSDAFATWYGKQKPEVQSLSASPAAKDAIRLISLFKDARAKDAKAAAEKEAREKRLERAEQPQGVAHEATPSTPTDDEAFDKGFKRGRSLA